MASVGIFRNRASRSTTARFAGSRVRHVKVVRLRPRGGDLRAEHLLKRRFTRGHFRVVIADADDLDDAGEHVIEGRHHCGFGLNGGGLTIDARRLT